MWSTGQCLCCQWDSDPVMHRRLTRGYGSLLAQHRPRRVFVRGQRRPSRSGVLLTHRLATFGIDSDDYDGHSCSRSSRKRRRTSKTFLSLNCTVFIVPSWCNGNFYLKLRSCKVVQLFIMVIYRLGFQHSIACRQLKAPQGILGGIGRRMSSLLWGGMNSAATSEAVKTFSSFLSLFCLRLIKHL